MRFGGAVFAVVLGVLLAGCEKDEDAVVINPVVEVKKAGTPARASLVPVEATGESVRVGLAREGFVHCVDEADQAAA
jgi:hypothetical protein